MTKFLIRVATDFQIPSAGICLLIDFNREGATPTQNERVSIGLYDPSSIATALAESAYFIICGIAIATTPGGSGRRILLHPIRAFPQSHIWPMNLGDL